MDDRFEPKLTMSRWRNLVSGGFILALGVLFHTAHVSLAHTLPISYLTALPGEEYLHLELTFNPFELSFFSELDQNHNGRLDPTEWEDQQTNIVNKILGCLEVEFGGKGVQSETSGLTPDFDSHHATVRAHYPGDARSSPVRFVSRLATLTSGSHFTLITFGTGEKAQTARLDPQYPEATFAPLERRARPTGESSKPTAAPPPDELVRLGIPMLLVLIFCLLGWYARKQQLKSQFDSPEADSADEIDRKPTL